MKKAATLKRILTMLLALSMLCGGCMTAFAAEDGAAASNLASLREKYDLTQTEGKESAETFPEKYDLRELGYVTPVKFQNPWGTCWGFAAIAAAETSILSEMGRTYEETGLDLSEHQLAYFARTPLADSSDQEGEGYCMMNEDKNVLNTGGWMTTVTSVLSSGIGVVNEEMVPYRGKNGNVYMAYAVLPVSYSGDDDWTVPEEYRFLQTYELEDSNILPEPSLKKWNELETGYEYLGYNQAGTDAIKSELLAGHGVSVAFAADQYLPGVAGEPKYLSDNYCHYTYDGGLPNHAVTIVGWDDTVPASDFVEGHQPPADGAWIVKNSWGSEQSAFPNLMSWGIKDENGKSTGYFYLSYYDQSITSPESLNFDVDLKDDAYAIDQYDYLATGTMYQKSWLSADEMKMAAVFTAEYDEDIRNLSTEVASEGETVTFDVYLLKDGFTSPEDGELAASQTETFGYSGFHRTKLETPVHVNAGQKYAVVVTETVDTEKYGKLYEVSASQAWNKAGAENYNTKVEEDYKESSYGVAIVNEGENWLYSMGGWNDWKKILDVLSTDEYYQYRSVDNFSIKAYAELSDAAAVLAELGTVDGCCYPEPEHDYLWYMEKGITKCIALAVAAVLLFVLLIILLIRFIVAPKRKWKKRTVKVLFIGNSHTYFNDMPLMVKEIAGKEKRKMEVTMLAHGGWTLREHLENHGCEAAFNIKNGGYEYVILQEHTHPFEEEETYLASVKKFAEMIREAGAVPVIYATWAKKGDAAAEPVIEKLQKKAAKENDALLAPAGERWWEKLEKDPEADLYFEDGQHAGPAGSRLAAQTIWEVLRKDSVSSRRWKEYKKNRRKKK